MVLAHRSIVQIGIKDETKYATPLKPATNKAVLWSIPTELSKITVLYYPLISIYCRSWGKTTHISNQVDTRQLLHHLPTHAQQRPVQKPLGSIGKDHFERALQSCLPLFYNGMRDFVDFNVDDLVIVGDGTGVWLESPDDASTFVSFTVCNQLSLLAEPFIN